MPMLNLLLLAELKALGVCPCGVYYFCRNWGHWACALAEFITFGRTGGIGRVPMLNLLLLAELKALGVCPCRTAGGGDGVGGGGRGGDESDAMGVAPAAVWRRPARPGRGSRIRCIWWNRFRAQQTPDTRHQAIPANVPECTMSTEYATTTATHPDNLLCHKKPGLRSWRGRAMMSGFELTSMIRQNNLRMQNIAMNLT